MTMTAMIDDSCPKCGNPHHRADCPGPTNEDIRDYWTLTREEEAREQ